MLVILVVTCVCALGEFGVEAALKVRFEDLEILAIDPKYLNPDETEAFIVDDFENDETTITTKLEIIKTLPATAQARFTLTGLSMGQYTAPTGVDIDMALCEMLDEPIIMGPFFAVLGFTEDNCPPEPGVFSQEGYKLPVEMLPDEFPENKYLVYIEITIKGKPMIAVNIYADIQSA